MRRKSVQVTLSVIALAVGLIMSFYGEGLFTMIAGTLVALLAAMLLFLATRSR